MKWDAEKYDDAKSPQTDAGMELIAIAAVKAADSVLDLGCGTGRLTAELARLAYKGKVVGIDPTFEMIQKAREVAARHDNILLLQIPAERMDFRDEFDLVYSNSAMQWIMEQEEVITRAYMSLRNKGRIAIQLPARDFCWAMMDNIRNAISALGLEAKYEKMGSPWRAPLKDEMRRYMGPKAYLSWQDRQSSSGFFLSIRAVFICGSWQVAHVICPL